MHVSIIQINAAHYHMARLNAARSLMGNGVRLIQVSSKDSQFASLQAERAEGVYTLFEEQDYHSISTAALEDRLIEQLTELNPDVVAVNGWATRTSYIAVAWAKKNGRSTILLSESNENDAKRSVFREAIKRLVVSKFDAALVGGAQHKDYLRNLGMSDHQIFMGYNVVDNDNFANAAVSQVYATRENLSLPSRFALASCRFSEKKNVLRLLDAFATTAADRNDIDLVLLGDGALKPEILKKVESLGLEERVSLPGFVGYKQLPSIYAAATFFIHIPTHEQWGLVVNEAASAGLPLIVSEQCGSHSELLKHGENGLSVCAYDLESISSALSDLAGASRETLEKMSAASRTIMTNWSPRKFALGLQSAAEHSLKQEGQNPGLIHKFIARRLKNTHFEKVG